MRVSATGFLVTLFTLLLVSGLGPGGAKAQEPPIGVSLKMKGYFQKDDKFPVEITVRNRDDGMLLVNRGFVKDSYHLKIRVIDPEGRLLMPHAAETKPEPDPKPLPILFRDGRSIQAAECEPLSPNKVLSSKTADLRKFYHFALPGYYTAQVQIDTAVYKGLPCDLNDFRWQGVLRSETVRFFYEGETKVSFSRLRWPVSWKTEKRKEGSDVLSVQIYPPKGKTAKVFNRESLRLNGVGPYKLENRTEYLQAYFDEQEAFRSLGAVDPDKRYPVQLTGRFVNGTLFGGARLITVTSP
jgi:hypothetical protein